MIEINSRNDLGGFGILPRLAVSLFLLYGRGWECSDDFGVYFGDF